MPPAAGFGVVQAQMVAERGAGVILAVEAALLQLRHDMPDEVLEGAEEMSFAISATRTPT